MCPTLLFNIPQGSRMKRGKYYRFERHTLMMFYYEFVEGFHEFKDELSYKITYLEFLDRLENGSIKPEELNLRT